VNKILLSVIALFLLSACDTTSREFKPLTTVRVITTMSYPEFPDIEPLSDTNIIPWIHDMPRDMSILSVKSLTECRKIETYIPEDKQYVVLPIKEQSDAWWQKCGENPIIPNSNIFIGFTQENWNIILENFAKLKERNWQYKQRIIEINRQREEWRKKAEEERIRSNSRIRNIKRNGKKEYIW
jgi:hypothetical protein